MNLLRLNIKRSSITGPRSCIYLLSVVKLLNNDGKVHILINFCELRCMKLVTKDSSNNKHDSFIFNKTLLKNSYLPFGFVAVGL